MAIQSTIEWTDTTWNPIKGCSRVSPGCTRCYAERFASRFGGDGQRYEGFAQMTPAGPRWTGRVEVVESALMHPMHWRKPRRIFVNSMSDLFHEELPEADIKRVFNVMNRASWHQYQILTKRAERVAELSPRLTWGPHIWMGVSIESVDFISMIEALRRTGAAVKFLSIEPLLGPIPGDQVTGVDWVIVGGESGPGARPMSAAWARELRDHCQAASIPFFFKQWGRIANNPDRLDPTAKENGGNAKGGRRLDGWTWDEMPKDASPNVQTGPVPKSR